MTSQQEIIQHAEYIRGFSFERNNAASTVLADKEGNTLVYGLIEHNKPFYTIVNGKLPTIYEIIKYTDGTLHKQRQMTCEEWLSFCNENTVETCFNAIMNPQTPAKQVIITNNKASDSNPSEMKSRTVGN